MPFIFKKPKGGYRPIRKAGDTKTETLRRLRAFLDTEEPQTVDFLVSFWQGQQNAISYAEIKDMILNWQPSNALFERWQQDYSMLVTNQLAPGWRRTMANADEDLRRIYPRLLFDPAIGASQEYISQRGAALVTMFTNEQREAVRSMIAQSVHYDAITPDVLSRIMRPVIGLTERQAVANMRYWNAAWQSGIDAGLSSRAAERRADRMAATYAARQHRYRAMNIARTELAMAYNEGAHGATQAAQEQGYIGDTVKIWLTAADERVCEICEPLDGEQVNMNAFFSSGKKLPPAHPQCRCAVAYVEITNPLHSGANGGIMQAEGVGDTDGHTTITDVRQIDFNDEAAIDREIEQFKLLHANDNIEHALVLSPSGKVYVMQGNEVMVNPGILSRDELLGSIVVHNHPLPGDSFSRQDFSAFFEYGFIREDVISGTLHNTIRYNGVPITSSIAKDLYRAAFGEVRWNAIQADIPIGMEQLETMRQLSKTMEGLMFSENT